MYYLTVINSIILGIVCVALLKQNSIEITLSELIEKLDNIHESQKNESRKTQLKIDDYWRDANMSLVSIKSIIDEAVRLKRENIRHQEEIVNLKIELQVLKNSKS